MVDGENSFERVYEEGKIKTVESTFKEIQKEIYGCLMLHSEDPGVVKDDDWYEAEREAMMLSIRFAVANTWDDFNGIDPIQKGPEFTDEYMGREVKFAHMLNGFTRTWLVYFKELDGTTVPDDSIIHEDFVVCIDIGNGWFIPLTKFNDLRLA